MFGRKNSEVLDALRAIEAEFAWEQWSVAGIHVWPIVRVQLMHALSAPPRAVVAAGSGRRSLFDRLPGLIQNRGRNLAAFARARISDAEHEATPRREAELVFLSHSTCRTRIGDSWVDMYFDPLADALEAVGQRCSALEFFVNGDARLPRHRASTLIELELTGATLAAAARGLVETQLLTGAREDELARLSDVMRDLGFAEAMPSRASILASIGTVQWAARAFERALRSSHARLGGVVTWYTLPGMAFCLACRRAGIPVFDLQHGTMAHHAAYLGWTRVRRGGYPLLPSHFWVWRDEERRWIEEWAGRTDGVHRAFVGGNLWLQAGAGGPLFAEHERVLVAERGARQGRRVILVSLQYGRFAPTDALARTLAATPPAFEFWLRLHPGDPRDRERIRAMFEQVMPGRFELDRATDWPLPLLLRHADAHVTLCSSVVTEAALLGLPSVVMDPIGVDLYEEETKRGLCVAACEPGTLGDALLRVMAAPRVRSGGPAEAAGITVLRDLLAGPRAEA